MVIRFSLRAVALAAMAAASLATANLATAIPAAAEGASSGTFDLEIKGFRAGVLQFNGTRNGTSYSVAGRLESTGIAAMVRKIRFDAKRERPLDSDSRGICRRPFPGCSIESE